MFRFRFPWLILFLILFIFSNANLTLGATSYKALPKTETASLFRIIHNFLREEQILAFSRKANFSKQGATAMTMYAVRQETIQFYFQELPQTISKKILLETIKLGYRLLNSSGIAYTFLDTLENLSVQKANQIAKDWLTANDLQATGGEISFSYLDYENQNQISSLQYIILYYPEAKNSGKIIAAFYSPESLIPSRARASIPWPYEAWHQAGNRKISPFIVEIEGQVEKQYSAYGWKSRPNLSTIFPSLVPRFSFQEKSSGLFAPLSWIKDQVVSFFSPSSPQEIVITSQDNFSTEIEDLRKTVQSLKEVVKEKSFSEDPPKEDNDSSIKLAEVIKELANSFSSQNQEEAELIKLLRETSQTQAIIAQIQSQPTMMKDDSSEEKEESSLTTQTSQPIEETFCSIENLPQPAWDKVIFNEIAWMGTTSSSNDEWLELKNISSQSINLEGWQIFNQTKHLTLRFNENDSISYRNFFLLERGTDQSLPGQIADKIYQGAIKNSEEKLYLFDQNCQLQDIAEAKTDWPAGDNNSKRTMERKENLAWQTSYSVGGTPNKKNSQGWQPSSPKTESSSNSITEESVSSDPTPTDNYPPLAVAGPDQILTYGQTIQLDASQSGDNLGIVSYKWDITQDSLWNFVQTNPVLELEGNFSPGEYIFTLEVADAAGQTDQDEIVITILEIPKILISEIQIEGENSQDEFIELFNPQNEEVSLINWKLTKKTATGNEATLVSSKGFNGSIPPQGYLLITPSNLDPTHGYKGEVSPDLYYSNASSSLADNNTLLLYNPLDQVIDKVGFGQGVVDFEGEPFPENPEAGFSLGRLWNQELLTYEDKDNNQNDFLISLPTPKAQNKPYLGPVFPEIDFYLSDLESGSLTITTQPEVKVNILNDQEAGAWFLSEEEIISLDENDPRWLTVKPDNFTLSPTSGEKTIFLWLKDQNGMLSPQYSASITLSQNPPQAVYDLSLYPTKTNGEILLTWTAPQMGEEEPVYQYIIKQSLSPITEDKWETATLVSQELTPQSPGTSERLIVPGLDSSQAYYFALKSKGEGEVLSPLSNNPSRQAIAASGTPNDPYIVTNCQELQEINLNPNASYQLAHNIDCSATQAWNNQQGFEPLGNSALPFTGLLDGRGFTIDHLHVNRTANNQKGIGLIGKAEAGAQLLNLGLRNADIRGYEAVGGLIGWAQGFSNDPLPMIIDNCYTTGYLASSSQGEGAVGGLLGDGSNLQIDHSWSTMEIEASQANKVGGLVGKINSSGKIRQSHYQGNVRGGQKVGGLIGFLNGGEIEKCWTKGEIRGDEVGGLAGEITGKIENSYSQAKVSTISNQGGGFVFYARSSGATIINSYSTGYLYGVNVSQAGFLGKSNNSEEKNCYWDFQTSGQAQSRGSASGLTTDQMQNQASFTDWDFANVWTIKEGNYPSLRE
jgi:hypothetical protein